MSVYFSSSKFHIGCVLHWRSIVFMDERMLDVAGIEFNLSLDVTSWNRFCWRSVHVSIDSFAGFVSIVVNVRFGILENHVRMLALEAVSFGIVTQLPVLIGMVIVNHVLLDEC